jgi:pimeloyl-ACP methyl ester carboxylesterase
MRVLLRTIAVLVVLALVPPAARAADKLGIVLMHGLQGQPKGYIKGLATTLGEAGYLVATPEMCWSKTRLLDRPLPDCLKEVDAAVASLRQQGATGVVVAGHSMGGVAAIAYGATHDGLTGIIGLAPAGDPQVILNLTGGRRAENAQEIGASIAKAQALVAQGKGDTTASFVEVNQGRTFTVDITAATYLSFLGPDSLANLGTTIGGLKAPILWVAGNADPTQRGQGTFDKAPANPMNRYVSIDADHAGTPDASRGPVLAWLKDLARH